MNDCVRRIEKEKEIYHEDSSSGWSAQDKRKLFPGYLLQAQ